ncbi:ABC transporter permease [Faucicola mancuniensis]|uniref:ABC transporter permease n=1 Tax=Faucicola mancuniensis TaxID=1309795 RepID=UPI003977BBE6
MTSYVSELRQFNKSFKIQLRVIYALLMREIITRYGRHNLGFVWLFLEPMVFTLGITTIWYFTKAAHGGNIPIVPFAVTGYSTILLWRNSSNRVGNAVEANIGLLYHRNVKVIDVFLARILLEGAGATISFIVLSLFFISIGVMELPNDFLLMVKGWFLLVWFTIALAFTVGALFQMSEVIDRLWHAITYLLFPLSGTAFFVAWLPDTLKKVILYLPMVHSTEMLRHGYYGNMIPTYENPTYMIWFNMCLSFIGLVLVRHVSNNIEASS